MPVSMGELRQARICGMLASRGLGGQILTGSPISLQLVDTARALNISGVSIRPQLNAVACSQWEPSVDGIPL